MAFPFQAMSDESIEAYLAEVRHAVIATNRSNGPPHVSTIWYFYESGTLYFSVEGGRLKDRFIARDPRIAICIDAGHPDARSVVLYGNAEIVEPTDARHAELLARIDGRYMTDEADLERYQADVEASGSSSRLFALRPDKIIARDYN